MLFKKLSKSIMEAIDEYGPIKTTQVVMSMIFGACVAGSISMCVIPNKSENNSLEEKEN